MNRLGNQPMASSINSYKKQKCVLNISPDILKNFKWMNQIKEHTLTAATSCYFKL